MIYNFRIACSKAQEDLMNWTIKGYRAVTIHYIDRYLTERTDGDEISSSNHLDLINSYYDDLDSYIASKPLLHKANKGALIYAIRRLEILIGKKSETEVKKLIRLRDEISEYPFFTVRGQDIHIITKTSVCLGEFGMISAHSSTGVRTLSTKYAPVTELYGRPVIGKVSKSKKSGKLFAEIRVRR